MIYATNFEAALKMVKVITKRSQVTTSDAFQFLPWIINQVKVLVNSHNPDRFPEDSISNSHFRDRQK